MLHRLPRLALLGALVLAVSLSACGGSSPSSSSASAGGAATGARPGPGGPGRGFASDPAVAKCLKAAGVAVPTRGRRPTGTTPQGAPAPQGTTPRGAPPAGGRRGFGGGLGTKARAALAKCGVQLPQGPQQ